MSATYRDGLRYWNIVDYLAPEGCTDAQSDPAFAGLLAQAQKLRKPPTPIRVVADGKGWRIADRESWVVWSACREVAAGAIQCVPDACVEGIDPPSTDAADRSNSSLTSSRGGELPSLYELHRQARKRCMDMVQVRAVVPPGQDATDAHKRELMYMLAFRFQMSPRYGIRSAGESTLDEWLTQAEDLDAEFTDDEAAEWIDYGFHPKQATMWHRKGVGPKEARKRKPDARLWARVPQSGWGWCKRDSDGYLESVSEIARKKKEMSSPRFPERGATHGLDGCCAQGPVGLDLRRGAGADPQQLPEEWDRRSARRRRGGEAVNTHTTINDLIAKATLPSAGELRSLAEQLGIDLAGTLPERHPKKAQKQAAWELLQDAHLGGGEAGTRPKSEGAWPESSHGPDAEPETVMGTRSDSVQEATADATSPTHDEPLRQRTTMRVSSLRPNTINATVFTASLSGDGIQSLVEDIKRRGLRQPIEVTPEGVILDGERRWRAAQALGWEEVDVVVVPEVEDDEVPGYILDAFTSTRDASLEERVQVFRLALEVLGERHGRPAHRPEKGSRNGNGFWTSTEVRREAAKLAGFSSYTTANKADRVFREGDDDIKATLSAGDISISAAYDLAFAKPQGVEQEPVVPGASAEDSRTLDAPGEVLGPALLEEEPGVVDGAVPVEPIAEDAPETVQAEPEPIAEALEVAAGGDLEGEDAEPTGDDSAEGVRDQVEDTHGGDTEPDVLCEADGPMAAHEQTTREPQSEPLSPSVADAAPSPATTTRPTLKARYKALSATLSTAPPHEARKVLIQLCDAADLDYWITAGDRQEDLEGLGRIVERLLGGWAERDREAAGEWVQNLGRTLNEALCGE